MTLFELMAILNVDTREYEKKLKESEKKGKSFSDKLKTGFATAGKVAAAGLAAATAAATAFAVDSVKAGMSFDASMAQVAATMGKTVDEITELRDFAQQMGQTTAFSASEAADALNYMALAGYTAEQSMKALPNVLNLAASGNIDLARASDMVTDAQSALGLSFEESAALVDQMAKASSKSNTSVAQLGEAILTIGATARNVAGGTVELSTALGILADNGIKGSEGGTKLRNVLLSIQSKKFDETFGTLGISAYDANGNLRPLQETLSEMGAKMSEMTAQEKDSFISKTFNRADLAAVNALLETSVDRWDELGAAIENSSGAAEKMASTQLDNLAGDITLFKSALESVKIVISDGLTPTLRNFVQFGTDGFGKLSEAFRENGFEGAMEVLGGIISDGLQMITEMAPTLVEAGAGLLINLTQGIIDNLPSVGSAALEIALKLAESLAEAYPTLIPAVIDAILTIVNTLTDPGNLDVLLEAAFAITEALANALLEAVPRLIEAAPKIIENLVTFLSENLGEIVEFALKLMFALIEGLAKASVELLAAAPMIIMTLIEGIVSAFGDLIAAGGDIVNSIKDGFQKKVEEANTWGKDLMDKFVSGIREKWENLKQTVRNVAGSIKKVLGFSEPEEGPLSDFHTYAPDMMQLFAKGIRENEHLITDQLNKSFDFGDQIISANAPKPVGAGGVTSITGLTININGANYSDEQALAEAIADRLQRMTERRSAVYA